MTDIENKIKATVLFILSNLNEGLDFTKLFRIMYFAQQESLITYGKPIFMDDFHALEFGPVPSFTYKCIQMLDGYLPVDEEFADFIKSFMVKDLKVYKNDELDIDELSKSDIKSLNISIEKYKDIDSYNLFKISHDKAWFDAFQRAKVDPEKDRMSLAEMAKAGNALEGMVEHIRENELLRKMLL